MAEAQLSGTDARQLTDRIKVAVEGTWQLIQEAYTSRAWASLGYETWDEYCTREFGTSRLRLPREERQEVVASLRESGLTTRAIASATGLARNTVMKQLAQNEPVDLPDRVTGVNGKSYARARPTPGPVSPRREPEPGLWYGGPADDEPELPAREAHATSAEASAEQAVKTVDEAILRHVPINPDDENREWRRNFLAALSAARRPLQFRAADVADRADHECLDELARFVTDLTKYHTDVKVAGTDADVIQIGGRR